MRISRLAPALLAVSILSLSACNETPAEQAAPEGIPGVSVSNARLVLPAVKGNPAALYFDIVNAGDEFVALRAVSVADAKEAMMHETVNENGMAKMLPMPPLPLEKGKPVKFEPGGKHVMVMDVAETLKAGDTTEATATFAGGDKMSFPAKVEAAGGGN